MKLETKVGAFFVASLFIIGWLVFKVENLTLFGKKPTRDFTAIFEQASGLPKQSRVRMAGVEIGRVQDIVLQGGHALVTFSIDNSIPIHMDAAVKLANIGILGERYIDVNPGNPASGFAIPGMQLTSHVAMGLDAVMESLGEIATDLKGITYALNASFGGDHGRMKLDDIIDNIQVLTSNLKDLVYENHYTLNRTMANIEAISHDLRERLPMMAKQFEDLGLNLNEMIDENRPDIKGITSEVHKLAQGFQATGDDLRDIIARMNRGEGTIGKLLTDETTIAKLNTAADNLNEMLTGFKGMDLTLDMGVSAWSDRGGQGRASLGLMLAPRNDYWYSIELATTPDGKVRDETQTVTQIDPITGQQIEVPVSFRTIKTQQTFAVSAQFNKRVGDNIVLHGGIIDGTGGAGAEFRAFGDRFRLGALAYDFNKRDGKEHPRYRVTTSYDFWNGLYAQLGVQDIANKETRSYFIGGGIRWHDDHLKKLVGLAGVASN